VITSLAASRTQDIRERERRYLLAMGFRVVCLVSAVLLFHGTLRVVAMVIAIIMPWLAVVFANQPRLRAPAASLHVEEPERPSRGLAPGRESRVIEPD
jgi:hypothetical protein